MTQRQQVAATAGGLRGGHGPGDLGELVGMGGRVGPPRIRHRVGQPVGAVTEDGGERVVDLDHLTRFVDHEQPVLQRVEQRCPPRAFVAAQPRHPQRRAHPGQQLLGGERLHQIVVRAGAEGLRGRVGPGAGRDQHHRYQRRARVRAQRRDQPDPVQAGHHHIGHDQIRRISADRGQRRGTVRDSADPVMIGQQPLQVLPHVGVVVGDQHPPRTQPGPRRTRRPTGIDGGQHGGGPGPGVGGGVAAGQPAQRLRDEGVCRRGPGAGRRDLVIDGVGTGVGVELYGGVEDLVGWQVSAPQGQRHGERRALVGFADRGEMVPPWSSTSSLASASPMPLPSIERAWVCSIRWNRSNSRGSSEAPIPMPVSVTSSTAAGADRPGGWGFSAQTDPDLAVEGELHGIGQQVEHHLLPHRPVEVDRFPQRRAVHLVVQAGPGQR